MSTLQAYKHVLWYVRCFYIPDFITLFGPAIFTFILANYIFNYPKCCLPAHKDTKHSKMPPTLPSKSESRLLVQVGDESDVYMLNTDLNQLGDSAEGDGEGEDDDNGLTGKSYRLFIGYSNIKKL